MGAEDSHGTVRGGGGVGRDQEMHKLILIEHSRRKVPTRATIWNK
jgi:hypothetical protein